MTDFDLIIIGGGAIGLTSAYLAARSGRKVLVLEASSEVGGLLGTFSVGQTRLEHFYHHFFSHDIELQWLCRELKIAEKLRFHPTSMGVFRDGKHYNFNGPKDLLKFLPIPLIDRLRFAASSLYLSKCVDWKKSEDEPALDWFYRNTGKAATDAIWRPMLEIKFGPHAREVPVAWMAGRLRQRMNSRERGDEKLGYIDGSLQTLLNTLLNALNEMGVTIMTGTPVSKLIINKEAISAVHTPNGDFTGKQVLATIPSHTVASLILEAAPDYAKKLAAIRYFGAVCTILELNQPLSQTYWLNVADPGYPFGGVIEHTNLISPSVYGGRHLVYLSRYFEANNPLAHQSTAEIATLMSTPLNRLYPDFNDKQIKDIHVFRTNTAATVCDLSFSQKVPPAKTPIKNLFFSSMVHVYPDERSCNNAIRIAASACSLMNIDIPSVPAKASLSAQIGFE
jgi:protoporphyrinogen oxidase